jgi:hypothetical protein
MQPFLDEPPISQTLTAYDREHMVLYLPSIPHATAPIGAKPSRYSLASIRHVSRTGAARSMTRISPARSG